MARQTLLLPLLALSLPLVGAPAPSRADSDPALRRLLDLDRDQQYSVLAEPLVDAPRTGWLRHVEPRKGAGFEVRRPFAFGSGRVELSVRGPVMKRKRLGLTFEVQF